MARSRGEVDPRRAGGGAGTGAGASARGWDVVLSPEVAAWYVRLGTRDRAFADRALDRLAGGGPGLPMPHGQSLGEGLYELRFSCEGVSRRITYGLGAGRRVMALTTFRKQRDREHHEIGRARAALRRAVTRARAPAARRGRAVEMGR